MSHKTEQTMKSDRELLELAAQAAGIEHGADRLDCGLSLRVADGRHRSLPRWNPLTDDADALRLAVKLNLRVMPQEKCVYVENNPDSMLLFAEAGYQWGENDFEDVTHRMPLPPPPEAAPATTREPTMGINGFASVSVMEMNGDDPYAATRRAIVRAVAAIALQDQAPQPAEPTEAQIEEYEILCNGEWVGGASGKGAKAAIAHYLMQYEQDGECEVYAVTRRLVDRAAFAAKENEQ